MALNRAWFNALIDDDGSNAVGTVWNKTQILGLMDTIDAELLRLDPGIGTFFPYLAVEGSAGSATYSSQTGFYTRAGRIVAVSGRIVLTSKGSLPSSGNVQIINLPVGSTSRGNQTGIMVGYCNNLAANVSSLGTYMPPSTNFFYLTRITGGGSVALSVMGINEISPTLDIIFGGTFQTD